MRWKPEIGGIAFFQFELTVIYLKTGTNLICATQSEGTAFIFRKHFVPNCVRMNRLSEIILG
jgi:hypothetical protein